MTADVDPETARIIAGLSDAQKHEVARQLRAEDRRRQVVAKYPTPLHLAKALDPTYRVTPWMEVVNDILVQVNAGAMLRTIFNVGSQEGKSILISYYGRLWRLIHAPWLRCVTVSYAESLASRSARQVRTAVQTYGATAPLRGGTDRLGISVSRDLGTRSNWEIAGWGGGLLAVGLSGGFTGRPADDLVVDDPYKDRAAAVSHAISEGVWEWWQYVAVERLPVNAPITIVHTRWDDLDLTGRLLAHQDKNPPSDPRFAWQVYNFPAVSGLKSRGKPIPDALNRPPGEWLVSTRDRHLDDGAGWKELRRTAGAVAFSAIYLGSPVPPEGGAFNADTIDAYRVQAAPAGMAEVTVAVDPSVTGTGDEAGLIGGGITPAGHIYVTHDRSEPLSTAGWARKAHLMALDLGADTIVYEKNRTPDGTKVLTRSWRRLAREALALLAAASQPGPWPAAPNPDVCDRAAAALISTVSERALRTALGDEPDDPEDADNPSHDDQERGREELDKVAAQLLTVWPHVPALRRPMPHRIVDVHATRGKLTRATPVSQVYEEGRVHHVGTFTQLEHEQVSWRQGQDSPDRMDAAVWLVTHLLSAGAPTQVRVAKGVQIPTRTGGAQRTRRR